MFVIVLGLLVPGSGCSRTVAGAPSAVPGAPPAAPASAGSASSATARARAPTLQSDVLADECLLDAGQFGALLGRRVRAEQSVVRRADGTRSTSCYGWVGRAARCQLWAGPFPRGLPPNRI